MFNKSKTNNINTSSSPVSTGREEAEVAAPKEVEAMEVEQASAPTLAATAPTTTTPANAQRGSMMEMISTTASKPSILSEGFSFRGEIAAKGAIHVEGALNGQIQVDELTIGARGQVEGVVTCSSLHIKGKFSGTATCNELIVTSSASVDGHVVYQTLSVQKGASIKGELLLVK
jgi:cytoskeletal protein CcmA (bactofilin family)